MSRLRGGHRVIQEPPTDYRSIQVQSGGGGGGGGSISNLPSYSTAMNEHPLRPQGTVTDPHQLTFSDLSRHVIATVALHHSFRIEEL